MEKEELKALKILVDKYHLPFFIDYGRIQTIDFENNEILYIRSREELIMNTADRDYNFLHKWMNRFSPEEAGVIRLRIDLAKKEGVWQKLELNKYTGDQYSDLLDFIEYKGFIGLLRRIVRGLGFNQR